MALFYPTYFGPISTYGNMLRAKEVEFEVWDNFERQTYRNRCYILGPNGKQLLSVPLYHNISDRKPKSREMLIDYKDNWVINHIRSLDTAYSGSPFYEFYRDDLLEVLNSKPEYLHQLQKRCHDFVFTALDETLIWQETSNFRVETEQDYRFLVKAKGKVDTGYTVEPYVQVFKDRHGFESDLSILDLIFNLGPEAASFLI